ncbi:translesion DNA synthesis-associated protein ImuA [Thalassotalea sp. M1531]|uniref:Translesion DNA synthesis-associated protein ImuA n=1 Tax=Thalassotalea algicola TaxID=2716224 RepID=A0A7Y0LBN8_9GAMM|nr:translesion DNA synthesis-associated protein ImuA [Thalassotalea algicola]NMP31342.1 translesion DNA synthesis-associated protein ImuA [Thalassotalea algicola]
MQIIEQLKTKALIWQGYQAEQITESCSSSYPVLDCKLNGGFPKQGVIEIRSKNGIGELRLILPYLQQRGSEGLVIFIAPPSVISAESLSLSGLNLEEVWVLDASDEESLWCAEQCLKSGCCTSVVLWHQCFEIHHIRRLTLACEQGAASLIIFRANDSHALSLPVRLTLTLVAHPYGLQAQIDRRRAGAPTPPFVVDMASVWPELSLSSLPENVVSINEFKLRAV